MKTSTESVCGCACGWEGGLLCKWEDAIKCMCECKCAERKRERERELDLENS